MKKLYMLNFRYAFGMDELQSDDEIAKNQLAQVSFHLGTFSTREEAEEAIPFYLQLEGFNEYTRDEFFIYPFQVDKMYVPNYLVTYDK
jgi:hypothetical protein